MAASGYRRQLEEEESKYQLPPPSLDDYDVQTAGAYDGIGGLPLYARPHRGRRKAGSSSEIIKEADDEEERSSGSYGTSPVLTASEAIGDSSVVPHELEPSASYPYSDSAASTPQTYYSLAYHTTQAPPPPAPEVSTSATTIVPRRKRRDVRSNRLHEALDFLTSIPLGTVSSRRSGKQHRGSGKPATPFSQGHTGTTATTQVLTVTSTVNAASLEPAYVSSSYLILF